MTKHAAAAVGAMLVMFIFSVGTCAAEVKIGFVDFIEFAQKSKRAQEEQSRFQGLVAQKRAALEKKKKELEDLQEQIQKQAPMLKEDTRNEMIKKLGIKEMELKLAEREAENALRNEQKEAQEVFQRDVIQVIAEIRKQKGLSMVVNGSALLSVDDSLNLTDEVIKAYDAQKGAPAAAKPAPAPRPPAPKPAADKKPGPK
ncbi:MAG: OmpH family outer membrane protein [Thermodesulfobacteriota bacterium]